MLASVLAIVPPQSRPVVVAIIAVLVCVLLLRPRVKPAGGRAGQGEANNLRGHAGNAAPLSRPATSISTVGTLVEFRDGQPTILPNAADALKRIASTADLFLVTQLPVDSNELENATIVAMANAGIIGADGYVQPENGTGPIPPLRLIEAEPRVLQVLKRIHRHTHHACCWQVRWEEGHVLLHRGRPRCYGQAARTGDPCGYQRKGT